MGAKEREKIRAGIKELGKAEAYEVYTGEVASVDEDNLTIDVKLNEDVTISDVRLKATVDDDKGSYVIPAKGSYVAIAQLDGGVEFTLLRASQITRAYVKIEDTTHDITKDGVVMNQGNNKGMLILDKSVERWNNLEEDINNLKQIITSWVPVPQDGGAALKSAISSWAGQILQKTQGSDVENDKVKH